MNGRSHTISPQYRSHGQKEVVFISTPAMGMLPPTIEFARRLVLRGGSGLSATVLLIPVPHWPAIHSYTQSLLATSSPNLNFLLLPPPQIKPPTPDQSDSYVAHVSSLVESHGPGTKQAVSELAKRRRVVGVFVDMFCTAAMDVAGELGLSSYIFFASPAGFLSFVLDSPELDPLLASEADELILGGFSNPVPRRVLPTTVLKRGDGYFKLLEHAKKYLDAKGIVVNTARDLEPYALNYLDSAAAGGLLPKIYPVGPILNIHAEHQAAVMTWLDGQPDSAVVFLCFGSQGSLSAAQAREVARGLRQGGFRFLWSCRDPPRTRLGIPGEYASFDGVLPRGFQEETKGVGLVCGWVPQAAVLGHAAVGGFVSHCGWNSVLESLWHGVPAATWPVYAEQQMNAFEMVRELGLAVEITMDYRGEDGNLVSAEEVEEGIKRLMAVGGEEVRAKVKDMSEKIRTALMESESSYESLGALLEDLMVNE